jgi:Ca2+-transporting ATPase
MNLIKRLGKRVGRAYDLVRRAFSIFFRIDGAQWAGAFAFNAFISLFPLIILFVAIAALFIDRNQAREDIIGYLGTFFPVSGDMQNFVSTTLSGVVSARGAMGGIAFVLLVWSSLQCFITLILATNLAWGTVKYSWWRLPLKSLLFLAVTAGAGIMGMGVPLLMKVAREWFITRSDSHSWIYDLGIFFIPWVVMFLCLVMFYKLAPRRPIQYSDVWVTALVVTVLLQAALNLFGIALGIFTNLNAVYGTFGGIMALLMWIYLSGFIFIFGACLCAAQAKKQNKPEPRPRGSAPSA